jgi:hypothetical protein
MEKPLNVSKHALAEQIIALRVHRLEAYDGWVAALNADVQADGVRPRASTSGTAAKSAVLLRE